MSTRIPDPFVLVIFGASGDLTRRKLLPAVFGLYRDGLLPEPFAMVGFARSDKTDDAFRAETVDSVHRFARPACRDEDACRLFAEKLHYVRGGYDSEGLKALKARLEEIRAERRMPANVLFDLATPAEAFGPIVDAMGSSGLVRSLADAGGWARIIIEKPFGSDLAGARDLNRRIAGLFSEDRTFRIDHYLGKETVQNILVFRFANSLFEPVWNRSCVDHVQITVAESLGVGERGGFYDRAGALRDIVQNHMMNLIALTAMEPPAELDARSVHDGKVKLLSALRPLSPDDVSRDVVRAQYAAGTVEGRPLQGYLGEKGVASGSRTETFAALRCFVDNPRWQGVPFYLRTGKCMPVKMTEITVHFKPVAAGLFRALSPRPLSPNVLGLRIQPNEGISLRFEVKVPWPAVEIHPYQMEFSYVDAFHHEPPDAYERLLLDAALGDPALFIRDDEVEAAWSFVTPILDAFEADRASAMPQYPAGSWGPKEADDLIRADGRRWEILHRPLPHTKT